MDITTLTRRFAQPESVSNEVRQRKVPPPERKTPEVPEESRQEEQDQGRRRIEEEGRREIGIA